MEDTIIITTTLTYICPVLKQQLQTEDYTETQFQHYQRHDDSAERENLQLRIALKELQDKLTRYKQAELESQRTGHALSFIVQAQQIDKQMQRAERAEIDLAAARAQVEAMRKTIESKCNLFLEQSEEIAREHFVNDEWDDDESFGKFTTLLDCRSALVAALEATKTKQ